MGRRRFNNEQGAGVKAGAGFLPPRGGYTPWLLVAAGAAIAARKSKEGAAVYALASVISLGYQTNTLGIRSKLERTLNGDYGRFGECHPTDYLSVALSCTAYAATFSYVMPVIAQGLAKYSASTALCSFGAFTIAQGLFDFLPGSIVQDQEGKSIVNLATESLFSAACVNLIAIALPSLLRPKFGRGAEFVAAAGLGLLVCMSESKEKGANFALKFGASTTVYQFAFSSMPSMFSGTEVSLSSFGKLAAAQFLGSTIFAKCPDLF